MDPLPLLFVITVGAVLVLVFVTGRRRAPTGPVVVPYERRPLFTAAERSFLGVLDQATAGQQLRVLGKIRLFDLLKVRAGAPASEQRSAMNRVIQKHVDFVLCSPADLHVVAVIELDDASHDTPKARARDELVDRALAAAGIPIHRFSARRAYSVQEIRQALAPLRPPPASDGAAGRPRDGAAAPLGGHPSAVSAPADAPAPLGSCPKCGRPLVERVGKRGPRQGTTFLGCSGYPDCRTIIDA
jgi:hypothetical protein